MRNGLCGIVVLFASIAQAASSNSLIDVSPDGTQLLVANTDQNSVTVVDLVGRKAVREVPIGDQPEGVAWVSDTLAVVTLYGDDAVAFLDTTTGKIVHKLTVEDEPYGVVPSPDRKKLYVTHDYPGLVSEIDVATRTVTRTMPAGKNLRGLGIAPDGKTIYACEFHTAKLHAIDLATGKVIETWAGSSMQNLARHVAMHPKRGKAYISHTQSRVHIFNNRGSIVPEMSICDLFPAKSPEEKRRRAIALDTYNGVQVVTVPWESDVTPDGTKIYTVYAGTEDMNVSKVFDDDYVEMEPIGSPIRVGKLPRAVRVHPKGHEVYVYDTLDFSIAVFPTDGRQRKATIPVTKAAHSAQWTRGKELFHTASPPMTRAKWVSCGSCHPDGQSDGRVWQNPEGDRKTPPLFGLAHTHPLHWSADRDEVQDFEYTIRGKLMLGRGLTGGVPLKPRLDFKPAAELEQKTAGLSRDLDALAVYTNSFTAKPSPHPLTDEAKRGKALFISKETQCATCHSGPYYTDSRLQLPFNLHDVGTGDAANEKMGPKYDTPTLIGVYRSPPYLHDGRAATLMDVLTTCNKGDRHGKTSHLKPAELLELVAFLKALPYEPLPTETPNTVPH